MKKSITAIFFILFFLCFAGCGSGDLPETSGVEQEREQEQEQEQEQGPAVLGLPASGGAYELVGGTMTDVIREYGECRMYFDYYYSLFCMAEEADVSFFFEMPVYTLDPVTDLNLVPDDSGYVYYDFETGDYAPDDFIVGSVALYGDALNDMFGGAIYVDIDLIEDLADGQFDIWQDYDQGEVGLLNAGYFILNGNYARFALDDDMNVLSAVIYKDLPEDF